VNVAIAGAHGKVASRLSRLLTADGNRVVGLIRNPDHAAEVSQRGASPVLCDLEQATVEEIATAINGADAVVFAAGAGPGNGADRKLTMDRDGAIKLLRAATLAGTPRYLIVSGAGAEDPPNGDDVFEVYLRAKAEADAAVVESDREWTIVRPGGLTDDPGTGNVRIDAAPHRGSVSRDDVASVIARLLADRRSSRRVLYVNSGERPIDAALDQALGSSDGAASCGAGSARAARCSPTLATRGAPSLVRDFSRGSPGAPGCTPRGKSSRCCGGRSRRARPGCSS
jgi:uncharacterized protein YbjT (DUF2867 family)